MQIKGNFMFDPASHRDFLGACLGCGIDRRTIGDIIVTGDQGAQVICTPEIAAFISVTLTQVRVYTNPETVEVPIHAALSHHSAPCRVQRLGQESWHQPVVPFRNMNAFISEHFKCIMIALLLHFPLLKVQGVVALQIW